MRRARGRADVEYYSIPVRIYIPLLSIHVCVLVYVCINKKGVDTHQTLNIGIINSWLGWISGGDYGRGLDYL